MDVIRIHLRLPKVRRYRIITVILTMQTARGAISSSTMDKAITPGVTSASLTSQA